MCGSDWANLWAQVGKKLPKSGIMDLGKGDRTECGDAGKTKREVSSSKNRCGHWLRGLLCSPTDRACRVGGVSTVGTMSKFNGRHGRRRRIGRPLDPMTEAQAGEESGKVVGEVGRAETGFLANVNQETQLYLCNRNRRSRF